MLTVEDPHAVFNAFFKQGPTAAAAAAPLSPVAAAHPALPPPAAAVPGHSLFSLPTIAPSAAPQYNIVLKAEQPQGPEYPDYDAMVSDGVQPPSTKRVNYRPPSTRRGHGLRSLTAYLNEPKENENGNGNNNDEEEHHQQHQQQQQRERVVVVQPEPAAPHSGKVKYRTSSGERLFTLEDVKAIVAGALKEQDIKTRAEYEKLFYQRLHEQQLSMTRYIDELRNASSSDCSYIS